jgi:hypothetical protein
MALIDYPAGIKKRLNKITEKGIFKRAKEFLSASHNQLLKLVSRLLYPILPLRSGAFPGGRNLRREQIRLGPPAKPRPISGSKEGNACAN